MEVIGLIELIVRIKLTKHIVLSEVINLMRLIQPIAVNNLTRSTDVKGGSEIKPLVRTILIYKVN
jgi:hypothetical protein